MLSSRKEKSKSKGGHKICMWNDMVKELQELATCKTLVHECGDR